MTPEIGFADSSQRPKSSIVSFESDGSLNQVAALVVKPELCAAQQSPDKFLCRLASIRA